MLRNLITLIALLLILSCSSDDDGGSTNPPISDVNANSTVLAVNMTLEQVLTSGAATVKFNDTYFAIGHQQISANNQDPILMRFDDGELTWVRTDYETTASDGTGTGLIYDPSNNRLHVTFTTVGVDGQGTDDYRRFTTNGWAPGPGFLGSLQRIVVLTQINPENGDPLSGTFVYSQLSNMQTNFLTATELSYSGNEVVLRADSGFSPLKVDQTSFNCNGSSPIDYTISFNLDLSEALSASAEDCE